MQKDVKIVRQTQIDAPSIKSKILQSLFASVPDEKDRIEMMEFAEKYLPIGVGISRE